jgi:hypothetical protein
LFSFFYVSFTLLAITTSLTTLQEHGSPPKPKIEVKIEKSDNFAAVFEQKKQLVRSCPGVVPYIVGPRE